MSSIIVSSGITSTGVIVSSGNSMSVLDGGIADSTKIQSAGKLYIEDGGTANSTTINSGYMYISSGGSANGITNNGGTYGGITIFSGGLAENITNQTGNLNISAIGFANNVTISGGNVHVLMSGRINNVTVNRGGLYISSGGTATEITENGGYVGLANGANVTFCSNTISGLIHGKTATIHSNTIASDVILSGVMHIYSGGIANNVTVNEGGLYISSGGTATEITENGGSVEFENETNVTFVSNTVSGITINSLLGATVHSNTIFEKTKINYGSLIVFSGGIAKKTEVNLRGSAVISSGGTATEIIENGGFVSLEDGANVTFASNTIYGISLNTNDKMTVHSNTIASGVSVCNEAFLHIYSGGIACDTGVYSNGLFQIYSGGIAYNTTVNYRGYVVISSGGTHSGSLQFGTSSFGVSACEGAIIDFTVADRTEEDGYLIDNLSRISGAPTYTLTVSDDQASGTYKLADGASGFDKTITVKVENEEVGTLTVGGTLTSGDVSYALNLNGSQLTLTVSGAPDTPDEPTYIPVPSSSELISGTFNGIGGSFELTEDGNGVIHTASNRIELTGTIDTGKWELLGTGDFNKDGNDGLLWLEKETGYVYAQNDLTNFNEVSNKTNCLGVVEEGYEIRGIGDFSGTGIDGVVMKGPAFGDERISLNYGLPVWAREADGTKFDGWLGALVNTWQPGEVLEGDVNDLADINAKNYMYEIVDVGDYNGDGVDDVMLQNIMPTTVDGVTITGSGDVFTFLTGDTEAIKAGEDPTVVYTGCVIEGWEVLGSGDFNGDGTADVLLSDGTGVAGWAMSNGQRTEDQWFGNLSADEKLVGVADVNNDGTDDLLIHNAATEQMTAWLVKDGAATEILAIA